MPDRANSMRCPKNIEGSNASSHLDIENLSEQVNSYDSPEEDVQDKRESSEGKQIFEEDKEIKPRVSNYKEFLAAQLEKEHILEANESEEADSELAELKWIQLVKIQYNKIYDKENFIADIFMQMFEMDPGLKKYFPFERSKNLR